MEKGSERDRACIATDVERTREVVYVVDDTVNDNGRTVEVKRLARRGHRNVVDASRVERTAGAVRRGRDWRLQIVGVRGTAIAPPAHRDRAHR